MNATGRTGRLEVRTRGPNFDTPLETAVALSALTLAALLAVILHSFGVFLFVLSAAFIPLVGAFYPPIVLVLFLFANLLIPKLPLIPIGNYMVPIRIEDVFLACAFLSLLLRYLVNQERPSRNPLQKWMVAYAVVTFLSFLFGLYILGSVPNAKIGFLYWLRGPEYFAASYLCLLGVTNWKQYRQILVAFVVSVLLIGVYGILQEFSLVPVFDATHETGEIVFVRFFTGFGKERLFSTFGGMLDLPGTYLIVIPVLIALLVLTVSRVAKLWLAVVLALSLFCFYLTYARTPLVALVLVLAVCFWLLGKGRLGIALALFSALPVLLFSGYVGRLESVVDDPLTWANLGGRLGGSWEEAVTAVARSPLLGTGPASFSLGLGADGLYFMLLGMWGVGGLVYFLLLIRKTIRCQTACIQTSRNNLQRALAIGLFGGTVGLLVTGATIDSFYSSKVAFTFWFLMGLLLAGAELEKKIPASRAAQLVQTGRRTSLDVFRGERPAPASNGP
jgi:hypothetical protein